MQDLTAKHDAFMREAIETHRGRVVKTTGDGFHAVFGAATDGLAAALAGLRSCSLGEVDDQVQPEYRVNHLDEPLEIIQQENQTG
jgi:class 3 adenylate cyclase